MDQDLAAKRRKDSRGLTTRERQVLTLRVRKPEMMWKDCAELLGISKFRVTEIKRNLTVKGMVDDNGNPTVEAVEIVNG